MKKFGFLATVSGLCFLIAGVSPAYNISTLLRAGLSSPNVLLIGLQLVCLALMGLHLLARRPLNGFFALLPVLFVLSMLIRIYVINGRGLGSLSETDILDLISWAILAFGCILAAANKKELPGGVKYFLFLPAILRVTSTFMNNGISRLSLMLRYFDPGRIQMWSLLSPFAMAAGFLFLALWAASGGAADPGVETAPAPVPNNLTRDEDRMVRQYRSFLESGIITRAEYDAKMRSMRRK